MKTAKKILLINGRISPVWKKALRDTALDLKRNLEEVNEDQAEGVIWQNYDFIILDAGIIYELSKFIAGIISHNPNARIVIFSSVPAWEEARDVMLAGAVDYAYKTMNKTDIYSTLKKNLEITSSS
jgi:hypothetical protein